MTGVSFIIFFANVSFLETVSLKLFDFNFRFRGPVDTPKNVLLLAIDQKSENELGRWPWSRSVMVEIIDRLTYFKVPVVGLDIVFSAPEERYDKVLAESLLRKLDESPELKELKKYPQLSDAIHNEIKKAGEFADVDERLAMAFRNAGNIVPGYFFFTEPDEVEGLELDNEADYKIIKKARFTRIKKPKDRSKKFEVLTALGVEPNIKIVTSAGYFSGFFNYIPDDDGIVRMQTNVIKFRKKYFPSLSLQVLRYHLGNPKMKLEFEEYGVKGIYLGDYFVPSDEHGRSPINYYGSDQSFPRLSISDLLGGMPDEELAKILKGKIVIAGATSIGIGDIRNTPYGSIAGPELHATFIQNVLDRSVLTRAGWYLAFDAISILLLGFFLTVSMRKIKVFGGAVIALVLVFSYLAFQQYLFTYHYTLLNVLYPVLTIVLVYGGIAFYIYFVESKEKQFVKQAFEQYLSPIIIKQMMDDPHELKLGGEATIVTAFFTDIKGFSTFSEQLEPEPLLELLNEYLTEMTTIVMDNEGTLDKYVGDSIAAFFGAPFHYEDHPIKACRAALLYQQKLAKMRISWKERGLPEIQARIGVNTGKMVVGNMGSKQRFDYTMMGDDANLAARLEGVNKQYGTFICISDNTYKLTGDEFEVRELDLIRVVGRVTPVRIYELLAYKDSLSPDIEKWLKVYRDAYSVYQSRDWVRAIEAFREVIALDPWDVASERFIGRCRHFLNEPPDDDWDGVYTLTTK